MAIIQKPRARFQDGLWFVWCDLIGPSPRACFDQAYGAWRERRGWTP